MKSEGRIEILHLNQIWNVELFFCSSQRTNNMLCIYLHMRIICAGLLCFLVGWYICYGGKNLFETSYFSCFFKNHVINGSTRSGSMESTFHTSPVKHRSKGATKMSLESALSGAVNAEVYLQSNEPEAREFFKAREIWGRFLLGFCWEPTEKKTGSAVTSLWFFWLTYGIQECTEWKEMGRLKRVIPSFKISK